MIYEKGKLYQLKLTMLLASSVSTGVISQSLTAPVGALVLAKLAAAYESAAPLCAVKIAALPWNQFRPTVGVLLLVCTQPAAVRADTLSNPCANTVAACAEPTASKASPAMSFFVVNWDPDEKDVTDDDKYRLSPLQP